MSSDDYDSSSEYTLFGEEKAALRRDGIDDRAVTKSKQTASSCDNTDTSFTHTDPKEKSTHQSGIAKDQKSDSEREREERIRRREQKKEMEGIQRQLEELSAQIKAQTLATLDAREAEQKEAEREKK